MRKVVLLVIAAAALAFVAKHEGPAAKRYLKIESM
jgi:hypothetical protein